MTGFARYTVELWSQLELDGEPCAKSVGSLEVAWTQERLTDLKRKAGYGMSWGVEDSSAQRRRGSQADSHAVRPHFGCAVCSL